MLLVAGTADTDFIQSDCCCFVIPAFGFAVWLASPTATKLVVRLVVECVAILFLLKRNLLA